MPPPWWLPAQLRRKDDVSTKGEKASSSGYRGKPSKKSKRLQGRRAGVDDGSQVRRWAEAGPSCGRVADCSHSLTQDESEGEQQQLGDAGGVAAGAASAAWVDGLADDGPGDASDNDDDDDDNEETHCYCKKGDFGEMIACDNADCPVR